MKYTKERLAKWLYEKHGLVHYDKDYKQIPWAEIGYMVKDEYLKEADELLDVFAVKDIYKALKAIIGWKEGQETYDGAIQLAQQAIAKMENK
jgi:hypothetical protein